MTIKEFIKKYNLHDSLLEHVEYDKNSNKVKLTIDFCYWQQENYEEDMPETGMIVVEFDKVTTFSCSSCQINSDEIIEILSDKDNEIIIIVFNDLTSENFDIIIKADNVSVTENNCKISVKTHSID